MRLSETAYSETWNSRESNCCVSWSKPTRLQISSISRPVFSYSARSSGVATASQAATQALISAGGAPLRGYCRAKRSRGVSVFFTLFMVISFHKVERPFVRATNNARVDAAHSSSYTGVRMF